MAVRYSFLRHGSGNDIVFPDKLGSLVDVLVNKLDRRRIAVKEILYSIGVILGKLFSNDNNSREQAA